MNEILIMFLFIPKHTLSFLNMQSTGVINLDLNKYNSMLNNAITRYESLPNGVIHIPVNSIQNWRPSEIGYIDGPTFNQINYTNISLSWELLTFYGNEFYLSQTSVNFRDTLLSVIMSQEPNPSKINSEYIDKIKHSKIKINLKKLKKLKIKF